MLCPSRLNRRGAYRGRHDTRGGDAVDADVPKTSGADADGEVVWSWRPKFPGVKLATMLPHRGLRRWQTGWFTGESAYKP